MSERGEVGFHKMWAAPENSTGKEMWGRMWWEIQREVGGRDLGVLNVRRCLGNAGGGRRAVGRLKIWRAHACGSEAGAVEGMRSQQQVASRPGEQEPSSLPLGWEEGRCR